MAVSPLPGSICLSACGLNLKESVLWFDCLPVVDGRPGQGPWALHRGLLHQRAGPAGRLQRGGVQLDSLRDLDHLPSLLHEKG